MRRYLTLFTLFVRNSLQVALEYRADFFVSLLQSAFWLLWGVAGTLIFFRFTGTLGGWTLPQVLVVVGMFRIFEGVIDGIMRPNITRIVEYVQKGTLDFILLKPVDSQFMASLRQINLITVPDFIVGAVLIAYGVAAQGHTPSLADISAFAFLIICGIVIAYGLWMLLVTTAFWLVRVENIAELLTAIYDTGRFPVSTFGTAVRITLTFVVPIAFLTTFPSAALLGILEPVYLLIAPLMALILLFSSRAFWRFALRSYTSASS